MVRSRSDVIINYGSAAMIPSVRKELLTLRPDAGSVLVGHHYGGLPMPFEAQKESIINHAAAGVLPEIEVFHGGDAANLLRLVDAGLLRPPYCVTIFMNYNAYYRVPPTPTQLEAMLELMPPGTHWTVCVDGEKHLDMAAYAMARGGHVRTGLENSFELSPGRPPKTQAECVERIVQMARAMGREIASPKEARQALGIPRKPETITA
jgi:3-keto-5-aminohexanoate cleavage enzyme